MRKPRHRKVKLTPKLYCSQARSSEINPGQSESDLTLYAAVPWGSRGRAEEWMVRGDKGCEDQMFGWEGEGEPTRKPRFHAEQRGSWCGRLSWPPRARSRLLGTVWRNDHSSWGHVEYEVPIGHSSGFPSKLLMILIILIEEVWVETRVGCCWTKVLLLPFDGLKL